MATKIDLTVELQELDGSTLEIGGSCPMCGHKTDPKPLTVRGVLSRAVTHFEQGQPIEGEEKLRRYSLGLQFQKRDTMELTSEEVVLLKDLVNRAYLSPVVVGQVWPILEGESKEK